MLKKIKIKNLYDICAVFLVIVTLAFNDKSILLVILQLLFCGCTFLHVFGGHKVNLNKKSYIFILWYFIFILLSIMSWLWSVNTSTWFSIILSIIQTSMVGISIICYINNEEKLENIMYSIVLGSLILCMRLFLCVPFFAWGTERIGIYIGYGNVGVTYVLAYACLFSIGIGLMIKEKKYYLFSAILLLVSCMSGSKKGIFIFMVGILVFLRFTAKNPIKLFRNILFFVILSFAIYYLLLNYKPLYNAIGYRFQNAVGQLNGVTVDKSTRDRSLLIKYAYDAFKENPFLGVGIDAFRFYDGNLVRRYAHSNYMEVLADLGLIGFLIYYFIHFKIIYNFMQKKSNIYKMISIVILFAFLVGDLSSVSYFQEPLQLYLAVIFAINCMNFKKETGSELCYG